MFDRPQIGNLVSKNIQVNSCKNQNDFPISQYVTFSLISGHYWKEMRPVTHYSYPQLPVTLAWMSSSLPALLTPSAALEFLGAVAAKQLCPEFCQWASISMVRFGLVLPGLLASCLVFHSLWKASLKASGIQPYILEEKARRVVI